MDHVRQSTVMKVQNVADYVFEKPAMEWRIGQDFPNIAPPFPDIWMEWQQETRWCMTKSSPDFPDRFRAGLHLHAMDLRHHQFDEALAAKFAGCRWVGSGCFFLDIGDVGEGISMMPCFGWGISAEGAFVPIQGGLKLFPHPMSDQDDLTEQQVAGMDGFQSFLIVPFMALSFSHCRNVQFAKGPAHPQALQKARARKGKPPLLRWHTLTIEPVRGIIAASNGGSSALTPTSLHICRGHFKHFEERGLFGRHHGMFWWPMHARGSRSAGRVLKDYCVKPAGLAERTRHEG